MLKFKNNYFSTETVEEVRNKAFRTLRRGWSSDKGACKIENFVYPEQDACKKSVVGRSRPSSGGGKAPSGKLAK